METLQVVELPQLPEQKIDLVKYHGYSVEAKKVAEMISVVDDVEAQLAVDARSKIKTYRKEAESDRKERKAPFLEMGKRIDGIYNGIVETFDQADSIIEQKLIFFQKEKIRLQKEEEARRLAEYQKKIAEEQMRVQAEYEAKLKAEREKAKLEHRKPEVVVKQEAAIVAPPPIILPPETTLRGSQGASTFKTFWNYRVKDINELYKARPDLVKLEERRREILEAIKVNQNISGLEIFEDMNSAGR